MNCFVAGEVGVMTKIRPSVNEIPVPKRTRFCWRNEYSVAFHKCHGSVGVINGTTFPKVTMPSYGTVDHYCGLKIAATDPADVGPLWSINELTDIGDNSF